MINIKRSHNQQTCLIFSQDINRLDCREVTAKIPLSEIPFVMRALGYYPTEQEVSIHETYSLFFATNVFY